MRRSSPPQRSHPALAKLAVALKEYTHLAEQHAATVEVLRVIARSPYEAQPVFDAIVKSGQRLLNGHSASVALLIEGLLHLRAWTTTGGSGDAALKKVFPMPVAHGTATPAKAARTGKPAFVSDTEIRYSGAQREMTRARGYRSVVSVPMMQGKAVIGAITVTRREPGAFSKRQMGLLKTFADQAVIAIENARLFKETQEALDHQRASSEILRIVANSVENTEPVIEAITSAGKRLMPGIRAGLILLRQGELHFVSAKGHGDERLARVAMHFPMPLDRQSVVGATIIDKCIHHVADIEATGARYRRSLTTSRASGWRAMLAVPLLNEGVAIGALGLSRTQPGPFSESQIALARTFADQAVIAIRNAGQFREIRDRNAELKQSLDFQGAMGEILASISSSIADTRPVFDAINRNLLRLVGARNAAVMLVRNGQIHVPAVMGQRGFERMLERYPIPLDERTFAGRAILSGNVVHIAPVIGNPATPETAEANARAFGYNSIISAPMMRDGRAVGAITASRTEARAFDAKEIALIKAFADQAVIAIENARLFNETKEALERQTATAGILQVISSTPTDVRPVFRAIIESAQTIFDGMGVHISLVRNGVLELAAEGRGQTTAADYPIAIDGDSASGRAILEKRVVNIADSRSADAPPRMRSNRMRFRALACAPLLRQGEPIGVLSVTRMKPGALCEKQVSLLQTFADQAVIAIENTRLFNETREALERQTATADVLKVISASPTDVQPVFRAVAERAAQLCSAQNASVLIADDGLLRTVAAVGAALPFRELPIRRTLIYGRAVLERRTVHVEDVLPLLDSEYPDARANQAASGFRTLLCVPMTREGRAIGAIGVWRDEVKPFTRSQIELMETFAAQAVIAIENVRLFNETKEALERQTATADILRVIAASPSDTQPVFDAIAASAQKLFGAPYASVVRRADDMLHLAAHTTISASAAESLKRLFPTKLTGEGALGKAILTGRPAWISDVESDPAYSDSFREGARARGYRSLLAVPMLRDGFAIGGIVVARPEAGPFTDHQVNLLQTFADQAVIAIENVRLFNETKEALEQQTATAEILKVISSSPTDLAPVFQTIAQSCKRLLDGRTAVVLRVVEGQLHLAAFTPIDPAADEELKRFYPRPLDRTSVVAIVAQERKPYFSSDIETDPLASAASREVARKRGYRSNLIVPMLRQGETIGALVVSRVNPGPFSESEIALLQTFADQAVIAIENVRLFNETKEALEQQKASADVLGTISNSIADAKPVFDKIVESCARLFEGTYVGVGLVRDDGLLYADAYHGPQREEFFKAFPMPVDADSGTGRAILSREIGHYPDVLAPDVPPNLRRSMERVGGKSALVAPMLWEGRGIGGIVVGRGVSGPFSDKAIRQLKTFADQAVIAIQNARLFNETKEALEQQTATGEVLKIISSSPTDVKPVFRVIVDKAMILAGAQTCFLWLYEGNGNFRAIEGAGVLLLQKQWVASAMGRTFHYGPPIFKPDGPWRTLQVPDMRESAPYRNGDPYWKPTIDETGIRTLLFVPLIQKKRLLGTLALSRNQVKRFTDKEIELVKTFADQAVIAIENVRLFNETKEALERQTATADILRVISGTPTDTGPVFAAIVDNARRLTAARNAVVLLRRDSDFTVAGYSAQAPAPSLEELPEEVRTAPLDRDRNYPSRAILDGELVHIPDWEADDVLEFERSVAKAYGIGSGVILPLLREGRGIGALAVTRVTKGPFHEKEIALLRSFADQAVIAIENVRLFNETKEALEKQTAISEILRVISQSPSDVQPVFETIVHSAARLCNGTIAAIFRYDGELIHFVAGHNFESRMDAIRSKYPSRVDNTLVSGRVIQTLSVVRIDDAAADPEYDPGHARLGGWRRMLGVPMLKDGRPLGVIVLAWDQPGITPMSQEDLLRTFADQAVIAIENVRLFNETKEALEQQTAISEVLRVISNSPADVQPVLEAVASRAARICEASDARIFLLDGDRLRHVAGFGDVPIKTKLGDSLPLSRGLVIGRAVLDRAPVHIEDVQASSPDDMPEARQFAASSGWHTVLAMPLLRESRALGAITLRRMEKRSFSEKQIALLRTFADQAAIAIENVRLFNETQEALEQQTATTEVLNVISSSITDARPVFDAIARSVLKLYGARNVGLVVRSGETIDRVGYAVSDATADDGTQALYPIPLDEGSLSGRAILRGDVVHIRDVETEEGLSEHSRAITRRTGARSVLVAPMYSMGATAGALAISRRSPGGFSEREVEMIRTFADQAVIAMENVRLFREIEEKSAQLKEASEHKSHFLASMSHELRTPLNAILGFNEMLLDGIYGELNDDVRAPLENIQSSGKHLLRLINNVLDLAKIEAGRMELAVSDYSVQDTVASVHSTLQPLAAEKGLEFAAEVPADIPLARGDSGRIAQCLMNLAGNSLKFTKEGRVCIAAVQDNGLLRFSVSDTGIGIPADKLPHLFTEFKQTDATIASEYGGTGLGLSITKKFIEMHGGRIWVESEQGKGSSFRFEIPLRVAP